MPAEKAGRTTARNHFPRLIQVEQGSSKAVYKPIAGSQDDVIEQQLAFGCFDLSRAGSNLRALPAVLETHHETVVPPGIGSGLWLI